MSFGLMALFGLMMSIKSYICLGPGECWPSSAPMAPQAVFGVFALTVQASAIAAALALQCAEQGCDAAAGDSPHYHIIELMRLQRGDLLHRLMYSS